MKRELLLIIASFTAACLMSGCGNKTENTEIEEEGTVYLDNSDIKTEPVQEETTEPMFIDEPQPQVIDATGPYTDREEASPNLSRSEIESEPEKQTPDSFSLDTSQIRYRQKIESIEEDDDKNEEEKIISNGITVYLDPGHGGDAAGYTEYNGAEYERGRSGSAWGAFPVNSLGTSTGTSGNGYDECDVVYQIALKTKDKLEPLGYEVIMSRDDVHTAAKGGGTALGNWERGRRAAEYDYWVVIHADGGGAKGMHCVSYNCDQTYKSAICDKFITLMENYGRPIYTSGGYNKGYSGNSSGKLQAPSKYLEFGGDINHMLYIEAGFMDDADDLAYLVSEGGQDQIAEAITQTLEYMQSNPQNSKRTEPEPNVQQ